MNWLRFEERARTLAPLKYGIVSSLLQQIVSQLQPARTRPHDAVLMAQTAGIMALLLLLLLLLRR